MRNVILSVRTATVADELAFDTLTQEIRELAIRVLVEEVDTDEIRSEGYSDGYSEGESDGYAEARREARHEIADLEDKLQERDEEVEELKARINNMIARCEKCEYNMEGKLFPCPAHT